MPTTRRRFLSLAGSVTAAGTIPAATMSETTSPAAAIDFPAATGGTNTITHFGVGTASSGAGKLLYSGAVSPNISVSSGVTPQPTTPAAITEG